MRLELQAEVGECGLACLAMVASHYGDSRRLHDLRSTFAPTLKGLSLRRLIEVADVVGFAGRPVKLGLEGLPQLKCPRILHWDLNHFWH